VWNKIIPQDQNAPYVDQGLLMLSWQKQLSSLAQQAEITVEYELPSVPELAKRKAAFSLATALPTPDVAY